ncbi:MAG: hypothetical protein CHACPFDD_02802 [Phycisphaerae bacterium]|nr:hypothetical protein [Phycisphaerae bacterium]
MVSLPQAENHDANKPGCGDTCGTSCGAGLEKVYPSTAVRYGAMRMIGEFTYRPNTVFKCGAKVVVQTDRGIELGEQVSLTCHGCDKSVSRDQISRYIQNSGPEFYRLGSGRILREATPQDVAEHAHLNSGTRSEADDCSLMAAQLGLEMKIVTVEHLLGGERVIYYFMADGRVDFRSLVKELAGRHQTRIEMKQVGARDEARLVADYEICGRECCCKNFLKTLRPVTMKMAKVQKATLDLSKVSGRCGRLRCCLRYEHEGYESLEKKLPRRGSRIRSEHGTGVVIDRQILTQLVMFRSDEGRVVTVPVEEITERDLPPLPIQPPPSDTERDANAEPRDRSGGRSAQRSSQRPGERPRDARRERPPRGGRPAQPQRDSRETPSGETSRGSSPTGDRESAPREVGPRPTGAPGDAAAGPHDVDDQAAFDRDTPADDVGDNAAGVADREAGSDLLSEAEDVAASDVTSDVSDGAANDASDDATDGAADVGNDGSNAPTSAAGSTRGAARPHGRRGRRGRGRRGRRRGGRPPTPGP